MEILDFLRNYAGPGHRQNERTRQMCEYHHFDIPQPQITIMSCEKPIFNSTISSFFSSTAKKQQNGAALRTNSLGSGARSPPLERKSKFSALGRFFKPWKWRRKKKSDKFEATSKCKYHFSTHTHIAHRTLNSTESDLIFFFSFALQHSNEKYHCVPIEMYSYKKAFYFQKVQSF